MEQLPYFLVLLKKNVLLCTIISTSSFAHINFNEIKHHIYSNQAIQLVDYYLEDEYFSSIDITIIEDITSLIFHTTNSEYFIHPERYFQRSSLNKEVLPYSINGVEIHTQKRNLGQFRFLSAPVPPASIWVRHSSLYGYTIAVNFYTHNIQRTDSINID